MKTLTALITELENAMPFICLLNTSDAADERSSVDLGGRRILKKKNEINMLRPTPRSNKRHY